MKLNFFIFVMNFIFKYNYYNINMALKNVIYIINKKI